MNFVYIFAQICSLNESVLVAESQSQSPDFGRSETTDLNNNRVVYNRHRHIILVSNVYDILS